LCVKFSGAAQELHRSCIGAAQALVRLNIGITQGAGADSIQPDALRVPADMDALDHIHFYGDYEPFIDLITELAEQSFTPTERFED